MAKLSKTLQSVRSALGSTSAADSPLTKDDEFYTTGSYALNRVITGDIHKGFPKGRLSVVYGDSQSGKSFIVSQTVAEALKNNKIDVVYFLDSEGGGINILESLNVDMNKIEYIPINSIEDCSVKLLKMYDMFIEIHNAHLAKPDTNEDIRAIVILDSWGALAADKLINDAVTKGKQVQDMGLAAKLKNNLISALMMRTIQSGVTLLVVNHTYDNPGEMFASKIKPLPGGKKLEFAAQVILQSTKLLIKSDNKTFLTGKETEGEEDDAGFFKGNKLNFFCTKNRIAKPCFSANVYVDFDTGISKYDGLIDDAIRYGYIEKVYGGYKVPSYSDTRVFYKTLISSDEIWDTFIEKFNADSIERMKFSKTVVEEIKEAEKMIDSITAPDVD